MQSPWTEKSDQPVRSATRSTVGSNWVKSSWTDKHQTAECARPHSRILSRKHRGWSELDTRDMLKNWTSRQLARVVKAVDLKSTGFIPRWFKSSSCREFGSSLWRALLGILD